MTIWRRNAPTNQDGRIPYDHDTIKQLAAAATETFRKRRWNLTHAAMCVYGRVVDGFAEEMARTPLVDHDDANVRRVLESGHQQWTRQTGLPALNSNDNWRTVAVAAGAGDESLEAIANGDRKRLDQLVERIAAWWRSTLLTGADASRSLPLDSEPLTNTQQQVFELIQSHGPVIGTTICRTVGIEQSTLTSRIIPVLKTRRGVKNKRGAGYYVP